MKYMAYDNNDDTNNQFLTHIDNDLGKLNVVLIFRPDIDNRVNYMRLVQAQG